MGEIGRFILSLCTVSAATALIGGIIPSGSTRKYVSYVITLSLLLVLLSPLKSLMSSLSENSPVQGFEYDSAEVFANANSIVARHIRVAVCDKFSLPEAEVMCSCNQGGVSLRVKKRIGIIADDIETYVISNFGVCAEVELFE